MPEPPRDRKPPAAQLITVTVRRISPAGLIVILPDGHEGLIRERELAWDAEARRGWRERLRPGDSLRVVPLHKEDGERLEVSLRLAQGDPWLDAEWNYPVGALVEGIVTGVMPYGIFVELEPGVTGLVHTSRFPIWMKGDPGDVFWPGDYVKAIIGNLDMGNRRLELCMTDLRRRRWEVTQPASVVRRQESSSRLSAHDQFPLESLTPYKAKLVLVVDDDTHIREELASWLRNAGHAVLLAHDAETALQAVAESVPEVVLLDIELPDQSGIHVMRYLRTMWPEMRGILMTGQCEAHESDSELLAQIDAGVALLCKPFRQDELLICMQDRLVGSQQNVAAKRSELGVASRPIREEVTSVNSDQLWMIRSLARLRDITRAYKVILFLLDPASRQVRLVEQIGLPPLKTGMLPTLIHSPVRDVAEDGLTVRALDVNEATGPRFSHLLELIPFQYCLGLPVPARLDERYALFLFFRQPVPASTAEIVEAHATATAAALAAWLERRQFTAQTAELQRMLLLGELSRSLIHEVNNQRQNLPSTVAMLKKRHQAIAQYAEKDPTQLAWEIAEADALLQEVSQELDHLVEVMQPLLQMARQDQTEFVLLDQTIESAANMVRDTARRANVILAMQGLTPFCYTRAPAAALQQVLVNILLNAVQQIQQSRGLIGGHVLVQLAPTQHNGQTSYRICVEDDGPGIHYRLWRRIFEMGYTTRIGGSGMGLFISRNLIESLSGRLFVAESARGWGSTFVVELPRQA